MKVIGRCLDIGRFGGAGTFKHMDPGLQPGKRPGRCSAKIIAGFSFVKLVDLAGDFFEIRDFGQENGSGENADDRIAQRIAKLGFLKSCVLAPDNLGFDLLSLSGFDHQNGI